MNASQRARRRDRRRNGREAKRRESLAAALDYGSALSLSSLIESSKTCQQGVSWKGSVQSFVLRRSTQCAKLKRELELGEYRKEPATRFTLHERGCDRQISGVSFRDRVVQRSLCDNSLIPVLCHGVIDDNSASLKGRGMSRARRRFGQQMAEAHRRWGDDAVCVQYDFRKYFASIDSRRASYGVKMEYVRAASGENILDAIKLASIADGIVTEEKGVGLGNQTSQTVAIWYASPIDHYVREVLRCGLSGRYMDDGYAFCPASEAECALGAIRRKAESLGLTLHPRKSHATPISKPLTFLKTVYRLDGSMVRVSMCGKSLVRTMRHMRHVRSLLEDGAISAGDYEQSLASTYGNVCKLASREQRRRFEAAFSSGNEEMMRRIRSRVFNGALP